MTTPSIIISLSSIQTELGGTNPIALSEYYRGGNIVNTNQTSPNGTIPTSDRINLGVFRSVTKYIPVFTATIGSNQTDLNLRTWAVANGWDGSKPATITVGSGVYVYATTTAGAGLTINGSWPGGLTLINNGYIMGMGGSGMVYAGYGGPYGFTIYNGAPGGPAISLGISCTIQNNSYIGGGGGAGASESYSSGGGGAGGGPGDGHGSPAGFIGGGAGGGPGQAGGNGLVIVNSYKMSTLREGSGGGGGRIMPGTGGYRGGQQPNDSGGGGGGAGGGGGGYSSSYWGGLGGSAGNAGETIDGRLMGSTFMGSYYINNYLNASGGGGGWGAAGGDSQSPYGGGFGGAGGQAVSLNGYSVTWSATGTRYGAIS